MKNNYEKQYFIKLKNGEKLDCTKKEFDNWVHNKAGDNCIIGTPNGNICVFRKTEVLLAGYYVVETYDLSKGKR